MRLIVLAALLCACGPKPPAQRPCAESQDRRASGEYLHQKGGHHAYEVHAGRCAQSCEGGDQSACAEYRLLEVEQFWRPQRLTREQVTAIEGFCAEGHATACAWLQHPEHQEAIKTLVWRETPYQGEPGAGKTPIDNATDSIIAAASNQSLTLLERSTYSMTGTSDISFTVENTAGYGSYMIGVVADRAMTFTAVVGSTSLPEVYATDDVYVRMGAVELAEVGGASISIHATGSERGDVRFLQFANTGD